MQQNQIAGIIRAVLACVGGVMGTKYFSASEWEQLSGAITVIVVIVWSVIEKRSGKIPPVAPIVGTILLGGLLLCSGCATTANDVAMAQVAANTAAGYYSQPNNTTVMEFEGSNVTFCISGATRLTFNTPIPAKSVYPRDASTLSTVLSGATDLAKTATYGVLGYQGIKAMQAVATKEPTVVSTEKLVPVTGAAQ